MTTKNGWTVCSGSDRRPRTVENVSWGLVGFCPDCQRVVEVTEGYDPRFVEHIDPSVPVKA